MRYEWDENKRRQNLRRHGFDFQDAEQVFAGQTLLILDDRFDYGETRFLTYRLLRDQAVVIVHTETEELRRIISMRKANNDEETSYFYEVAD